MISLRHSIGHSRVTRSFAPQRMLDLANAYTPSGISAVDEGELTHRLYQLMHAGLWGHRRQSLEILGSLLWRPKTQYDRIASLFEASYGVPLEAKLSRRVARQHKEVLADLQAGRHDVATARLLHEAIEDKQPALVKQLLLFIPGEASRVAVAEKYSELFDKSLSSDARRLGYFEVQQVKALVAGNEPQKRAWQIRAAFRSRKPELSAIMRYLHLQKGAVGEAYQVLFGTSLLDDVKKRLGDDASKHLLAASTLPAQCDLLLSWSQFVKDTPQGRWLALELALGVLAPSERRKAIQALGDIYQKPLHEWLGVERSAETDALADGWRPTPAQSLKRELELRPISEDRILFRLVCLDGRSLEEVRAEFLELTGKTLDSEVTARLRGEALLAARLALSGQAQTPLEHIEKVESLHQMERSGIENLFARLLLDYVLFSAKGHQFDERIAQLRDVYVKAQADGSLSEQETLALAWALDATLIHSDTYRQVREKVRRIARATATNATLTSISPLLGVSGTLPRAILLAMGRSAIAASASVVSGAIIDGGTSSHGSRTEDFFKGLAKGLSLAVVSELPAVSATLPLLSEGEIGKILRNSLPNLASELILASYDSHSKNKGWLSGLKAAVKEVFLDSMVSLSGAAVDAVVEEVTDWASTLKTVHGNDKLVEHKLTLVFQDGHQTEVPFQAEAIEPWRAEKAQKALDKVTDKLKAKGMEKLKKVLFSSGETGNEWLSPLPLVELGRRVDISDSSHVARGRRPTLNAPEMALFGQGETISRFFPGDASYELQETFDYLVQNFEDITQNLQKHVYENGEVGRKLYVLLKAWFPHVELQPMPWYEALRPEQNVTPPSLWTSVTLDEEPLRKVTSGRALYEDARPKPPQLE